MQLLRVALRFGSCCCPAGSGVWAGGGKAISCYFVSQVSLQGNPIGDLAVWAIADALAANPKAWPHLSLADCQIADAGAITLCEALRGNRAVRRLDLHHNAIQMTGATAIAEVRSQGVVRADIIEHRCLGRANMMTRAEYYKKKNHIEKITGKL